MAACDRSPPPPPSAASSEHWTVARLRAPGFSLTERAVTPSPPPATAARRFDAEEEGLVIFLLTYPHQDEAVAARGATLAWAASQGAADPRATFSGAYAAVVGMTDGAPAGAEHARDEVLAAFAGEE